MGETYLVLAIGSIAGTNAGRSASTIVAPTGTLLPVWTIPCHVAGIATHATDDVGCVVLLLRTVVLAMPDLSTVLASLVLVVTEGTVQSSELSELITLEFVLAFGDGGSLLQF